jgi:hypothetical protein
MPVIGSNILAGASGQAAGDADVGTYTGKSCIFNGSNEFLNKTWGSAASDLDSFTISMWIKRGNTDSGSTQYWLVGALTGAESNIKIQADKINVHLTGSNYDFVGTRVLRDTSAWYHLVFRYDSDEGSAGDRFRCYINGELETWSSSSTIPSGTDNQFFANTNQITIGSYDASSNLFKGYIAQVCACDGQSLAPTSFAETSSDTGAWVMKEPLTGLTFGDNGFLLEFKQTGTGTASTSTIGADTSGETNHLTSTNLVAGDSALEDTPVNNFATWNPLVHTDLSFSEGNLIATGSSDWGATASTIALPNTGKWYYEIEVSSTSDFAIMGFMPYEEEMKAGTPSGSGDFIGYQSNDTLYNGGGTETTKYSHSTSANDVFMFAVDITDNTAVDFYIGVNGTWFGSGDPAAGSNPAVNNFDCSTKTWSPAVWLYDLNASVNFGVPSFTISDGNADGNGYGDFEHEPPTNYLSLCSQNLPQIEIGQEADDLATDHFNTVLWTGNSAASRNITGFGFDPDVIWAKKRSGALSWSAYDSVRGAGNDKELVLDGTSAEGAGNQETYGFLSAFITDGFTAADGTDGSTPDLYFNENTSTYVAHGWLAGSSGTVVAESGAGADGFNACTYFANQDAGFSIVKFTGRNSDISDGEETRVTHGLSAVPEFIIIKSRDSGEDWIVPQIPDEDRHLVLNTTAAVSGSLYTGDQADTTSSYFVVGNNDKVNKDGDEFIAYCWHSVEGFSKVGGSYVGNGATDGVFCYCGFTPSWVCVKASDDTQAWRIFDNARNPLNDVDLNLMLDSSGAEFESSAYNAMDFVSNGFKIRATTSADGGTNGSGTNYIFIAFSSGTGFKYATGN